MLRAVEALFLGAKVEDLPHLSTLGLNRCRHRCGNLWSHAW